MVVVVVRIRISLKLKTVYDNTSEGGIEAKLVCWYEESSRVAVMERRVGGAFVFLEAGHQRE